MNTVSYKRRPEWSYEYYKMTGAEKEPILVTDTKTKDPVCVIPANANQGSKEANEKVAKLICAAHEMLKALKEAKKSIDKEGITYNNAIAFSLIEAAIKKATE